MYLFIYLPVPGLSCGSRDLSCGIRDLVPWPGIKPGPPALGAWSLNHWTTKEVPQTLCFSRIMWLGPSHRMVSCCQTTWLDLRSNSWPYSQVPLARNGRVKSLEAVLESAYLIHRKTCIGMFQVASFVRAKTQKPISCPSAGEWISLLCCSHMVDILCTEKELQRHVTWMISKHYSDKIVSHRSAG